MKAISMLG